MCLHEEKINAIKSGIINLASDITITNYDAWCHSKVTINGGLYSINGSTEVDFRFGTGSEVTVNNGSTIWVVTEN